MSKLSEHYLQEQEQEFELELSYQEWLRDNIQAPTSEDLCVMEQEFLNKNSHFVKNRIITQKSLNNSNYLPKEILS